MSEYSIGKLVGALVGFVVGIVLVAIFSKFANKNRKLKTEYDERQKVLRGEGYKYGFYAMAIYAVLNTILGIADYSLPVEPAVYNFSYIFIGAVVDIGYCVFHDCYWGLNNNKSKWCIVMGFAGLINAVAVVIACTEGAFIYNNMISTPGINLLCAILCLFLAISVFVKSLMDKKEAAE